MTFVEALPSVNALLNATSAAFLLAGFVAIRARRIDRHKLAMQGAFVTSTVFLVCYLVRASLTGTHRFPGSGWLKATYLAVLFSHMLLATATLPLVVRTLFLARRSRFSEHRRIARWTWPVWMYVSVTGVLVYLMLYHLA